MKKRHSPVVVALIAVLVTGGCSAVSSTARRAGVVALGAATGGGAGYVVGDKEPGKAVLGAAVGGGLTHLALGRDTSVLQEGFDRGYVQGQSDAIKRQYFLRLAAEKEPVPAANDGGETVYYVVPGPELTADGRKLAPHHVTVRVVE